MPIHKRKTTPDTPSPTSNKRKKGSLNSYSCDACKKSKIKCQPVAGQDQCVACAKRGPQQSCVRTGVDNRSNDTTTAKLNALCDTFKSIYDDYFSVFYLLYDPQSREVETMSMMLRVANPTTYLPASGKNKLQKQIYPHFCTLVLGDMRLSKIRATKDSFSSEAWSYICKLQALLDAFIRKQLSEDTLEALGAALIRIESYGIPCDIIGEVQRECPALVLDPAAHENSPLLADYKNKLVHEQGLSLNIKVLERQTPQKRSVSTETIDLTEAPMTPSSTCSETPSLPEEDLPEEEELVSEASSQLAGMNLDHDNELAVANTETSAYEEEGTHYPDPTQLVAGAVPQLDEPEGYAPESPVLDADPLGLGDGAINLNFNHQYTWSHGPSSMGGGLALGYTTSTMVNQSQGVAFNPLAFANTTSPMILQDQGIAFNPLALANGTSPMLSQSPGIAFDPLALANATSPMINQGQGFAFNPLAVANTTSPMFNQSQGIVFNPSVSPNTNAWSLENVNWSAALNTSAIGDLSDATSDANIQAPESGHLALAAPTMLNQLQLQSHSESGSTQEEYLALAAPTTQHQLQLQLSHPEPQSSQVDELALATPTTQNQLQLQSESDSQSNQKIDPSLVQNQALLSDEEWESLLRDE